jgi:regulator of replication initiation timing
MSSLTTYDLNRVADDVDPLSENALSESGSGEESGSESGSESEGGSEGGSEEDRPIRVPAIPAGTSRALAWPGKGQRQLEQEEEEEEAAEEVVATQVVGGAGAVPVVETALTVASGARAPSPPAPMPTTLTVAPTATFNSAEDIFRAFATMTHNQSQFQSQFMAYTGQFQSNMLQLQRKQATLQEEQATLQEEQKHLQVNQEKMKESIEKMERTMQEMREENAAVKKNAILRLMIEFMVTYGMDSQRGIVVAFPFIVEGALCLVVSVPLLLHAMKAFIPHQLTASSASMPKRGKSTGWTRADVRAQLIQLDFLNYKNSYMRDELFDQFESVFAVAEKASKPKRNTHLDNYVPLYADKFFHAYRTCKEYHTFIKPWKEGEVTSQKMKGGLTTVISTASMTANVAPVYGDDEEEGGEQEEAWQEHLNGKMAWGHEVQKEVLRRGAIRQFYKQMYELAAGPSPEMQALVAQKWMKPFHFMGLKPVVGVAVKSRRLLVAQLREEGPGDEWSAGGEEESGAEEDEWREEEEDASRLDKAYEPKANKGKRAASAAAAASSGGASKKSRKSKQ